ncbi:MAG: SigB/SigF/SigG family RNA polymerase sigma factor [Firmicutes bacterium]|nr:SigB/SigF/SigG family RNA polymerase sigma factor [Bacillota bacterium]
MRGGDRNAETELVENNMGLVYSAVKRFTSRGYEFEDLVQIGAIGLIKAVKKFDPSFGTQFSTYAVPMIIGEIKRFMRDDGAVKISRALKETAMKGRRCEEMLRKRLNREPTIREIADECGISAENLLEAFEAAAPPESLYEKIYDNGGRDISLVDTIAGADMEEDVINRVLVNEIMSALTEREKKILILRYFRGKTQAETAKEFGVSQVQISRIEKKAMEKLRSSLP